MIDLSGLDEALAEADAAATTVDRDAGWFTRADAMEHWGASRDVAIRRLRKLRNTSRLEETNALAIDRTGRVNHTVAYRLKPS